MTTFATPGIETFTAPANGTYAITADGGQGGAQGGTAGPGNAGGLGAAVGGDVVLQAGEKLEIVVGGEGVSGSGGAGGGGGGSFVIEEGSGGDTLLAVAGGGGGAGFGSHGTGGVGQAASTGGNGGGASPTDGGAGGVGGAAGEGDWGGGGGYTGGAGGSPPGSTPGAGGLTPGLTTAQFLGGNGTEGGYAGSGGVGGGGGGGFGGGGGGGGFFEEATNGGGGGGSYFSPSATDVVETAGGAAAGNGKVVITLLCFCARTRIRTTRGEVAVEELAVGDLVMTASGAARPITWLGHKRIERPSREQWPVRVIAGAFGEGLPARDLFLSPGHAVCVDVMGEVFVPVSELVNGATIARVEVPEATYWHVELESHDVLLAEGLPCESYMDCGNRAFFGREYGRLAAVDPVRVAESLTRYARPFVDRGPIVEAIRERLTARADALVRATDQALAG